MPTVTKNLDATFTVGLGVKEQKDLKRYSDGANRTEAVTLGILIESFLRARADEYRKLDGPIMRDKYDALTPEQRSQVDTILATVVV